MPEAKYPECEKLSKVCPQSDVIHDFLTWLESKKLEIGEYGPNEYFKPIGRRNSTLMCEYFGVDPKKLEAERRHMMAALRQQAQ